MIKKISQSNIKNKEIFMDEDGEKYYLLCAGKKMVFLEAIGNRVREPQEEMIMDIDLFKGRFTLIPKYIK